MSERNRFHGSRGRRRILCLVLVSTFLFAEIGCIPYRKGSFRGPATVSDSGIFSYYRYHFRFLPAVPLDKAGKRTYTFRGLPKDPMDVLFGIEPFDFHDLELMKSLHTMLEVQLRDDRGILLCSASGSLSESLRGMANKNDDHWVLAYGGGTAEFWRPSCTDLEFRRGRAFSLVVAVENVDPRTPTGLSIQPSILGGGIELP